MCLLYNETRVNNNAADMKKDLNKKPVIYQAKDGAIELRGDFDRETIWASQSQIVNIFDISQSVASRHIRNIFKDGEVSEKSNMQKMHIANSDKPVVFYALDVILAVGYRTNSVKAIEFRKWATKTLKSYITKGYALDKKRIATHYAEFQKAVEDVRALLPSGSAIDNASVLELVSVFADTWLSLDAYDKDTLVSNGVTKKSVTLTAQELSEALSVLKSDLIRKGEATELFGAEREGSRVLSVTSCSLLAGKICIRRSKKRRRIFCTSLSRIIRFPMATSEAAPMLLCGFSGRSDCWIRAV